MESLSFGFKKLKAGDGDEAFDRIDALAGRGGDPRPLDLRDVKTILHVSRSILEFMRASLSLYQKEKCRGEYDPLHNNHIAELVSNLFHPPLVKSFTKA